MKKPTISYTLYVAASTIFLLLFLAAAVNAATYYVRTDGSDSNNGSTNSASGAWRTVDYAADHVAAGDVIRIQAGTYNETVTPGVSGSGVNSTVTFVADGAVNLSGVSLDGDDYLRFVGLTFTNNTAINLVSGGGISSGIEVWNCNHSGSGGLIASYQSGGGSNGHNIYVENSIFIGNVLKNNSASFSANTIGSLYASNEMIANTEDYFYVFGKDNIYYNNYGHSQNNLTGHRDFWQSWSQPLGFRNNLFEANISHGEGISNEHTTNITHTSGGTNCPVACGDMYNNVFRLNVDYNHGNGGISSANADDGSISYMMLYNNTGAELQEASSSATYAYSHYNGVSNAFLKNNLLYEAWGNSSSSSIRGFYIAGSGDQDYNLAADPNGSVLFHSDWSSQSHEISNGTVDFNNYPTDMTIGVSSDAIGNGGPLTTVTSASGSGTTFSVEIGEYFKGDYTNLTQYGGNLSVGDLITVGNDVVRISRISGDAITVTQSFAWANGDPVYFGTDTTPDIGAYPHKAGGYSINASYQLSGDTVTVTPNDASLVRMVVVFEDGIPVGADSTSPFSVSGIGSGTLKVNVYPRYASKTLYVQATGSGGGDSVPPPSGDDPPPGTPPNPRIEN